MGPRKTSEGRKTWGSVPTCRCLTGSRTARTSVRPNSRTTPSQDHYVCPNGQVLRRTHISEAMQHIQYRAHASICHACPLRARCTPGEKSARSVWRSFGQDYVERVRTYQSTSAYQKALRKRQVWIEPLFAEGKQWHQMRRFRLRRLWRVNTEALLLAAGQNLKRLLQHRDWGRRPFPGGMAAAADW